ncbi:MAG: hypothetical protein LBD01_06595 [Puniceicoccales bacterium]|jgi:hypothetical protein|nr:hypothetical protein [Puniceicoccales bacterium]
MKNSSLPREKRRPVSVRADDAETFDLPAGKGAAHRILRDAGLVRKRPRKHKADLRAIKATHAPAPSPFPIEQL